MKKFTNEFMVGLFIVLCLAGLWYMLYSTGKLNIKKAGYNIYVSFNEVAGLQKNAPVMINGLETGKVEEIKFCYDNDRTSVILKLWLDESAKVRANPKISIKNLGLMGEKYIQISSFEGKEFIHPGIVIVGEPYVDLDAMMAKVNGTLDDNKGNINSIVKNLEMTSKNFEEFSDDLKRHPWKLLFKGKEKPK